MTKREFHRLSGSDKFPEELQNCIVAIGNFDGVHRGHQAVLDAALNIAAAEKRPAVVLTFEPHPRSLFRPDQPVDRLTLAKHKAHILCEMGFDAVVEQEFTQAFAQKSAEEFVEDILVNKFRARSVVTGYDFHFGKNRVGTPEFLKNAGEQSGFDVQLVEAFADEGGTLVSSTKVRSLLCYGDVAGAAGLLGYRYSVTAEVIQGKQLGRTLGFPTANMSLPKQTGLKEGIYAVRFRRANGDLYDGVASFGRRPTVDSDGSPLLETFLFDFSDSLYGEIATVIFFGYLRGEVKFEGLEPLKIQMKRDEEEAKALLAGVKPISPLDECLSFQN